MNQSKKDRNRERREKIKKHLGIEPEQILCGKFMPNSKGKIPKESKKGRICNQKGAFGGKPAWMRGLLPGIYQTFDLTNHERTKLGNKSKIDIQPNTVIAKTLGE